MNIYFFALTQFSYYFTYKSCDKNIISHKEWGWGYLHYHAQTFFWEEAFPEHLTLRKWKLHSDCWASAEKGEGMEGGGWDCGRGGGFVCDPDRPRKPWGSILNQQAEWEEDPSRGPTSLRPQTSVVSQNSLPPQPLPKTNTACEQTRACSPYVHSQCVNDPPRVRPCSRSSSRICKVRESTPPPCCVRYLAGVWEKVSAVLRVLPSCCELTGTCAQNRNSTQLTNHGAWFGGGGGPCPSRSAGRRGTEPGQIHQSDSRGHVSCFIIWPVLLYVDSQ